MEQELRIVSGGRWTIDGRWVVVGPMFNVTCIVFDPDNGIDPMWDLMDCIEFVKSHNKTY